MPKKPGSMKQPIRGTVERKKNTGKGDQPSSQHYSKAGKGPVTGKAGFKKK